MTHPCLHCALNETMNAWSMNYLERERKHPAIGIALNAMAEIVAELLAAVPEDRQQDATEAFQAFLVEHTRQKIGTFEEAKAHAH